MKIFFSMPTTLYNSDIEKEYKEYISKIFPLTQNIIRTPSDYMEELKLIVKDMNKYNKEQYITRFFLKKIELCDALIYVNTYTKKGNVNFTNGVEKEINKAIKLGKDVYRLYTDDSTKKPSRLQKMDDNYFNDIVNEYNYSKDNWALKTLDDYLNFYRNNKEALTLMDNYFESNIGTTITVSHHNYLYHTNNGTNSIIAECKHHGFVNHAIVLPKQEYSKYCPFIDDEYIIADYSKERLHKFPDTIEKLKTLILKTRSLHKFMFILKNDEDKEYYEKYGIAELDENKDIIFKDGELSRDWSKFVGVRPLFDIDIKEEYKIGDPFFDKETFEQFEKTLNLFNKHYENTGEDLRLIFSGRGLYIEQQEMNFEENETNIHEFDKFWRDIRANMQNKMESVGINRLAIERGYGWQRYFKVPGAFHKTLDRVTIPLNIDESLDYKWLKEITNINLGLEQNTFQEIQKRAGNKWR